MYLFIYLFIYIFFHHLSIYLHLPLQLLSLLLPFSPFSLFIFHLTSFIIPFPSLPFLFRFTIFSSPTSLFSSFRIWAFLFLCHLCISPRSFSFHLSFPFCLYSRPRLSPISLSFSSAPPIPPHLSSPLLPSTHLSSLRSSFLFTFTPCPLISGSSLKQHTASN